MSSFYKKVIYLVLLSILFIACNQVDTKVTSNEDIIGSPIVVLERPEELLCQEGWVIVSYDVTARGEIENAHVLESEPAQIFDQYALDAFNKLKPVILKMNPAAIKGVSYKFTYTINDNCRKQ